MKRARAIWEDYGNREPYYAVLTENEFRAENVNEQSKETFFKRGRLYIDEVWTEFERVTGEKLQPKVALDYGCGVGRVLLPLSERCETVIGVDISSSMLNKARQHSAYAGRSNIKFQDVSEFSDSSASSYDLVHSYIVFQHVQPDIGYQVIGELLKRLRHCGLGMIHVTFAFKAPLFTRMRFRLYRDVPGIYKLSNIIQGRDLPFMPMYEYDLKRVNEIFQRNSCRVISEKATDHGFLGKMFFIRKDRTV